MHAVTDEDARRILAENVTRLVAKRDWSGRKLAEMTGENPMRISDLMNGRHTATIGVVTRVAAALDTSVDFLLTEHPEEAVPVA